MAEANSALTQGSKAFALPVPPSGRPSPTRSHPLSSSSAGTSGGFDAWDTRVASPNKRHHYHTRWSEWTQKNDGNIGPPSSGRMSASPFHHEDRSSSSPQPKLLNVLGMSPVTAGSDSPRGRRPRSAMSAESLLKMAPHLDHCGEDCYWRWLVHTLMHEADGLKESLADAEKDSKERALQRRGPENVIGYRDYILDELVAMTQALKDLRVDVPQVRQDYDKLQQQSDYSGQRLQELLAKQQELSTTIEKSQEWQTVTSRKLEVIEHESEESRVHEQELTETLQLARDETETKGVELHRLREEQDEMREDVKILEEKKEARKQAKAKKGKKK